MSKKSQQIILITIIATIFLVPSAIVIILLLFAKFNLNICTTTECMRTAVQILESLDYTVDPCEDFYMFACGNYLKNNFIPEDSTEIDSFTKIEDLLSHKLRILLEQPIENDDIAPFKFVKSHYKTCLNSQYQDNLDTLKRIFRSLGGWPVVEGDLWNPRSFDWRHLAHKFRRTGLHSEIFLVLNAEIKLSNSTERTLEIDEPQILYKEYLKNGLEDRITKAIYKLMLEIATIFGADPQRARDEMTRTVQFLVEMSLISVPPEKKRASSSLINEMTVGDLELIFPIVHWSTYINSQLLGIVKVNKSTTVNVLFPKYLKRLNALLLHTDQRTIANYMFWVVILNEIQYINQPLRNRLNDFLQIADGNTENTPKWKDCVDDVSFRLPLVVGALYVRNFFNGKSKTSMENIVNEIMAQFKRELENVPWMDETSRKRARKKAESISTFIGYPDELLDDATMSEFFSDLGEPPANYLLLDMKLTNFSVKNHYRFLRESVNKTDWRKQHSPIDVNAYYDTNTNSMHFPAGILQENFFSSRRPNFVNYGGIGFLIGHEITHGFDDEGRLFDENNNLATWWSEATLEFFQDNALCFVEQYDNITVEEVGIKINGENSQGENIADNGGIKHAYLAYKNWLSRHKDFNLPGLTNYTNLQMFWIASANSWCSKMRPEKLKFMLLSDEHVPMYFRINVPFANSEYFAEDFQCPLGSKMNPVTKCKVW